MDRVEVIKDNISIFDVMDKLGIEYPFRRTCQVHCPFHSDDNPSARVYEDTNKLWCWKCGNKTWDVIELVTDSTGMKFKSALMWLEREFEIDRVKSLESKFHALKSKKRAKGNIAKIFEEKFISVYNWWIYGSELLWERIFFCWECYEFVDKDSKEELMSWYRSSKKIVEKAFEASIFSGEYLKFTPIP